MKKNLKVLLIIILIIWIGLEIVNFVQYLKQREKIQEIENQYKNHQNIMRYNMDMSQYLLVSGPVEYRPGIYKLIFVKLLHQN